MFYVIPDTLLKVSLNTNKAGHHVLCDTWHIRQGDLSQQLEQRQLNVQQLQSESDVLDTDVENLLEMKQKVNPFWN
jgi:hypothetical protein